MNPIIDFYKQQEPGTRCLAPDSRGFPRRSSTATVCENIIIRRARRDWSWDPERVIKQARASKVNSLISDLL